MTFFYNYHRAKARSKKLNWLKLVVICNRDQMFTLNAMPVEKANLGFITFRIANPKKRCLQSRPDVD